MSDSTRKSITDAITRMLARREHSRSEVIAKLIQKGFSSDEFAGIVDEFVEADILSDVRFAYSRVRNGADKGQGPSRIRAELTSHQIPPDVIQAAIAQAETDWFALAALVRTKKFGASAPGSFKERQKQSQFLHYRGFSSDQIRAAMAG